MRSLSNAVIDISHLNGADNRGVILSNTIIKNTNISKAILSGANLESATLINCC